MIKKARELQNTSISALLTMPNKDFDCANHNKLENSSGNGNTRPPQDFFTCLLRNLYAGKKAAIRTGPGTTDWFQIGKGVYQGCI